VAKDNGLPTVKDMFRKHRETFDTETTVEPQPLPKTQAVEPQPADTIEMSTEKVVTTVRMSPTSLAMLHAMKSIETSRRNKIKFGDILDEAIYDYFNKYEYDPAIVKLFEGQSATK
jgi:hypothetical protein